MTNEEAIRLMKKIRARCKRLAESNGPKVWGPEMEACDIAIAAMQSTPHAEHCAHMGEPVDEYGN